MEKMKESYINLIYDREHLLMVAEMYHCAVKKEEEELERLTNKLKITSNFLKSTQRSLQESKLQICQLQKELKVSHLSWCMEANVLGIMEKPHVEENHEEGADLQVLVKSNEEEKIGQALIEVERKDELFFSTRKMADRIPYGSANKIPYSSIDWVNRDTFEVKKAGDEEYNFCNTFFVVTDIVLACGQPQGFNLQLLDTFHTHAHEVNSIFFCA